MLSETAAKLHYSPEASITGIKSKSRATVMEFIEGTRLVTKDEIMLPVSMASREQEKRYYDQLKYIVDPSPSANLRVQAAWIQAASTTIPSLPGLQHK
jgi:hypothetical protein